MTRSETSPLAGDAQLSVFSDPLADWANDDILFTKEARRALGARHPEALRVLDWPELRALFQRHETPANRHGRADRWFGLMSVVLGTAGLVAAAFSPLADDGGQRLVGVLAVFLTVGGGILAFYHLLAARSKSHWLGNRYWTERARGLYFQVLVNNLGLAAQAMRDDAAYASWKQTRARALDALPQARDVPARIRDLAKDMVDADVWVVPAWSSPPAPPPPSEDLTLLLSLIRTQRFNIQFAYTDRKLGDTLRTPRRRGETARTASDVLTFGGIFAAGVVGGLLVLGASSDDTRVKIVTAIAATASAIVMALRALTEGLNLSGDTSRYALYNAVALQSRAKFDSSSDLVGKIEALRALETHAYRELREFIAGHWRARYVM